MNMVKASQNPQMALSQMLQSDPKYSKVMDILRQNGGDPKKAFYSLADQMGVDPKQVLDSLGL